MTGAVIPGPWPLSRRRKGEPPARPVPAEPSDAELLHIGRAFYRAAAAGNYETIGGLLRALVGQAERRSRSRPRLFEVPLLAEGPDGAA